MNKQRDLLPWIFGGLSAAAIAVAFAAVSTHRATPALASQANAAQAPASAPALPVATTVQVAPPAAQPDSAPPSTPPQPQAAMEPDVQAGQIWECMTKGVKTFSNNPCGEKSTLLDVGPINTMPPLATHYARAYAPDPRYAPGYYPDQSAPAEADDYSDQNAADTDGNSYSTVQGVGLVGRRRAENIHRPHPAPAPPAHHSSAPVRRY